MKTKISKLLLLLPVVFITACAPTDMQVRVAEYLCDDKGGVYEIFGLDNLYVRCNDNTVQKTHGVVIPLEYLKEKNR